MVKNLPANAGDTRNVDLILGLEDPKRCGFNPCFGKIPWNWKWQLQYSCLENSLDRGAWWATVSGIAESDMTEHARTHTSVTLPQQ